MSEKRYPNTDRRPNGLWRYRARHGGQSLQDEGFATSRAAWEALEARKREADQMGYALEPGRVTMGEMMDRWLGTCAVRPQTLLRYERAVAVLKKHLGDVPVRDLTQSQVLAVRAKLKAQYAHGSMEPILYALKATLAMAVGDRIIYRSPLDNAPRGYYGKRKGRTPDPLPEGCLHDLGMAMAERYTPIPYLALWAGLRAAEIQALPVTNLDFDNRLIYVTQQVVNNRRTGVAPYIVQYTKSGEDRAVEMADDLAVILDKHVTRFQNAHGLLLANNRCGMVSYESLNHAWEQACLRVLGYVPRFHDLRHYFTSRAIGAGVPEAEVQRLGGWGSRPMMRHYTHSTLMDRAPNRERLAVSLFH